MEKSTKIGLTVGMAVIGSIIGIGLSSNKVMGAMMGFILPLFVVGLFHIWIKYGK